MNIHYIILSVTYTFFLLSHVANSQELPFSEKELAYWCFQDVKAPNLPTTIDFGKKSSNHPIDRFIHRKLKEKGLEPSPKASSQEIIRRAYFDLVGLAPTHKQVNEFLKNSHDQQFKNTINKLLASPHYGERWGQHWLDVVRYAESDGYNQDAYRKEAWRYRDYVVNSFNEDKPYGQFIQEQLAGDELAPNDPNVLVATSFLRHGVYEYNQRDVRTQWDGIINEVTDTTGEVFLGMSMGCARCHNHKFDPILQKDYYRLKAFFSPLVWQSEKPLATTEEVSEYTQKYQAWEKKVNGVKTKINKLTQKHIDRSANSALKMFPKDIQVMMKKSPDERTALEHQLATLAHLQVTAKRKSYKLQGLSKEEKEIVKDLQAELKAYDRFKPKELPKAMVMSEAHKTSPQTMIVRRSGNIRVEPGYLAVLKDQKPVFTRPAVNKKSTGRRTALAKWMSDSKNPLVPRVMVNRIWSYHFGIGLVSTPNDFGHLGEKPSHPELLDWLTNEFIKNNWSVKHIHQLIMTSQTYQQTSRSKANEKVKLIDPNNRLLWKMPAQRLDAEQIRDTMLQASDELLLNLGGPSQSTKTKRRTLYLKRSRNKPSEIFALFDAPSGYTSMPARNSTTTVLQSLYILNSPWVIERAKVIAKNSSKTDSPLNKQVSSVYNKILKRNPSQKELTASIAFINSQIKLKNQNISSLDALSDLSHSLLCSNEFLYLY